MPEWYLVVTVLAVLSMLSAAWWPLFIVASGAPLMQAILAAERATFTNTPRSRLAEWKLRALTAFLHLMQPLARLYGRVRWGLTPWRRRGPAGLALPWPQQVVMWSEEWQAPETRLQAVEHAIRAEGAVAPRGGDYDRWDLEVRGGLLGAARLLMVSEEHGAGKQLIRFRIWPRCSTVGLIVSLLFAAISIAAAIHQDRNGWAFTGALSLLLALRAFHECKAAMAIVRRVLQPAEVTEPATEAEPSLPVPSGPASMEPISPATERPAVYLSAAMVPARDHRIVGD